MRSMPSVKCSWLTIFAPARVAMRAASLTRLARSAPVSGQQRQRDCAQAGPDLDHAILRLRRDRGDDSPDHARVMQEVLTESFADWVHESFAAPSAWLW
jgi:hypothetical protein